MSSIENWGNSKGGSKARMGWLAIIRYVLTGPEAHSDAEVASMVGEIIGKPISFVNLTSEQYAGGMKASGSPDWMIDHMVVLEGIKANGWAETVSPDYTEITGQSAESMFSYLSANKERLLG